MRRSLTALLTFSLLPLGTPVTGQTVLIPHGTPAAVIDALKATLVPQGFKVGSTGDKNALFTLDRGNVIQQSGDVVHVVLELQVRFKRKAEGLEVAASEEAVGSATRGMDFRRRVENPAELHTLQRLLDSVRTELEARVAAGDSGARHDSAAVKHDSSD
jgi:hypothetical protein